jgi:uncharacterized protein YjbJ (UPF0337 family)
MKSSNRNKVEGTAKEVAGKVKQAVGKAVGNPRLQAEGAVEEVTGKVQKTVGHVQDRVEK